jgi:hypothetical protein
MEVIGGWPDALFVRVEMDLAAAHDVMMQDVDGRDKPGHDGGRR